MPKIKGWELSTGRDRASRGRKRSLWIVLETRATAQIGPRVGSVDPSSRLDFAGIDREQSNATTFIIRVDASHKYFALVAANLSRFQITDADDKASNKVCRVVSNSELRAGAFCPEFWAKVNFKNITRVVNALC